MELLHVLHFESIGDQCLDTVDICLLSSNDQVVHIYYDKQLSSWVAMDEQGTSDLDILKVIWCIYWVIFKCHMQGVCLRPYNGFFNWQIVVGCVLDSNPGGYTMYAPHLIRIGERCSLRPFGGGATLWLLQGLSWSECFATRVKVSS